MSIQVASSFLGPSSFVDLFHLCFHHVGLRPQVNVVEVDCDDVRCSRRREAHGHDLRRRQTRAQRRATHRRVRRRVVRCLHRLEKLQVFQRWITGSY